MAFNHIIYEKKDKVARITLNTPPSNWLTIVMMKEINEVLFQVKMDHTIQVLSLIMQVKRHFAMA
jgi:cyclohexa-1,5-dienecarbonyl-CoA hydratase